MSHFRGNWFSSALTRDLSCALGGVSYRTDGHRQTGWSAPERGDDGCRNREPYRLDRTLRSVLIIS